MLLPKVPVIAVGATTTVAKTTTAADGAQTTEQLPKTLFTLSVSKEEAEKMSTPPPTASSTSVC